MTDQRSILLIDDDAQLLSLLDAALEKAGHAVCTALDGQVGMQLFAAINPEVVITDIVMPTQEGIETIIALKKMRPAVKIIAMSGGCRLPGETLLRMASFLGADRVIAKPFRPSELVAMVADIDALTTAPL